MSKGEEWERLRQAYVAKRTLFEELKEQIIVADEGARRAKGALEDFEHRFDQELEG